MKKLYTLFFLLLLLLVCFKAQAQQKECMIVTHEIMPSILKTDKSIKAKIYITGNCKEIKEKFNIEVQSSYNNGEWKHYKTITLLSGVDTYKFTSYNTVGSTVKFRFIAYPMDYNMDFKSKEIKWYEYTVYFNRVTN